MKSKIVGKEIHLKKRPSGLVTEDNFELVEVEVPEIKKEGEFLVRNIWMSVDPFMRNYMVKGSTTQDLANSIPSFLDFLFKFRKVIIYLGNVKLL